MSKQVNHNKIAIDALLQSEGWMLVRSKLIEERVRLTEQLIKTENEGVRGEIKGIDLFFTKIEEFQRNDAMANFKSPID